MFNSRAAISGTKILLRSNRALNYQAGRRISDKGMSRDKAQTAQNPEPVSKPRRSRRREEADGWETNGIRLQTSAATSFRKGFEIASS
jgi:hypothetical protein